MSQCSPKSKGWKNRKWGINVNKEAWWLVVIGYCMQCPLPWVTLFRPLQFSSATNWWKLPSVELSICWTSLSDFCNYKILFKNVRACEKNHCRVGQRVAEMLFLDCYKYYKTLPQLWGTVGEHFCPDWRGVCGCWTVPSATGSAAEANKSVELRAFILLSCSNTSLICWECSYLSGEKIIWGQDIQATAVHPVLK